MEVSSEEREMEVEALKSIYGEQFTTGGGTAGHEPVFYEVKLEPKNIKIYFTIPGTSSLFDDTCWKKLEFLALYFPDQLKKKIIRYECDHVLNNLNLNFNEDQWNLTLS